MILHFSNFFPASKSMKNYFEWYFLLHCFGRVYMYRKKNKMKNPLCPALPYTTQGTVWQWGRYHRGRCKGNMRGPHEYTKYRRTSVRNTNDATDRRIRVGVRDHNTQHISTEEHHEESMSSVLERERRREGREENWKKLKKKKSLHDYLTGKLFYLDLQAILVFLLSLLLLRLVMVHVAYWRSIALAWRCLTILWTQV